MKKITMEDVRRLNHEFKNYTKNAEQHEFPILALINFGLTRTIKKLTDKGIESMSQKELRAMFRSVYRVIGKDFSEYLEA